VQQPFQLSHVNVGYDRNVPAGGLFAGRTIEWLM
jgi:hypothetical protein